MGRGKVVPERSIATGSRTHEPDATCAFDDHSQAPFALHWQRTAVQWSSVDVAQLVGGLVDATSTADAGFHQTGARWACSRADGMSTDSRTSAAILPPGVSHYAPMKRLMHAVAARTMQAER